MPHKEASIRRSGLSSDIQDVIGQRRLRAEYALERSMPARLANLLREFEERSNKPEAFTRATECTGFPCRTPEVVSVGRHLLAGPPRSGHIYAATKIGRCATWCGARRGSSAGGYFRGCNPPARSMLPVKTMQSPLSAAADIPPHWLWASNVPLPDITAGVSRSCVSWSRRSRSRRTRSM
jgi:hypothetical protein